MGPSPEVGQPPAQFASIDRSIRFQLLSQRIDAIGHTCEACRKDAKKRCDSREQEDRCECDLDDVRHAFDCVQAAHSSPFSVKQDRTLEWPLSEVTERPAIS